MTIEEILALREIPEGPYRLTMLWIKNLIGSHPDAIWTGEDGLSLCASFSQLWEASQYPEKVWVPRGTLQEHLIGRAEREAEILAVLDEMVDEGEEGGIENIGDYYNPHWKPIKHPREDLGKWSLGTLCELRRRITDQGGKG
jgi:hypothetical protein